MAIISSKCVPEAKFFKFEILETTEGRREVVRATDSITVLVHDVVNRRILLVEQPRAAMITAGNPDGMIIEAVAGRFDVALGPKALAVKEAKEEVGVDIDEDAVVLLNGGLPMAVSAGMTNEKAYLAYVPVSPDKIESDERIFGAEGEGERIRRVWLSEGELEEYACEDVRTFVLIQWLLRKLGR